MKPAEERCKNIIRPRITGYRGKRVLEKKKKKNEKKRINNIFNTARHRFVPRNGERVEEEATIVLNTYSRHV